MRPLLFLALLAGLGAGIVVLLTRGSDGGVAPLSPDGGSTEAQAPPSGTSPGPAPIPRDEHGAVIPSDPADDLAGLVRDEGAPTLIPSEVGERDIYLLDLYGQHTVEQLRNEREVLRSRFESELHFAFEEKFEDGDYRVMKPDDPAPSEPPRALDGSPLLTEMRTFSDPASGATEAHVATLHQDLYPAIYELRDTLEWLDARIGN